MPINEWIDVDPETEEVEDEWVDVPEDDQWVDAPVEDQWVDVPEESISQGEALWEGSKQGATWGFSDEIEAFLETGDVSGEEYETAVGEKRLKLKKAQDQWGKTYMAGEIGTGIVSGVLLGIATGGTGAVAGAGATVKTAAAQAAKIGAAEGAAYGLGVAEGEASEQAVSMALGGAIGAIGGGAFGAMLKGAPKMWKSVETGKATKEVQEEVIDLIGKSNTKAAANKEIDDHIINSISDDNQISISVDDISGEKLLQATDANEFAKDYLVARLADNTDDFVQRVKDKTMHFKDKNKEIGVEIQKLKRGVQGPPHRIVAENTDHLKAYYFYRNELIRYMETATEAVRKKPSSTTAKTRANAVYEIADINDKYSAKLIKKFNMETAQGKTTPESWNIHKTGQYLSESLQNRNDEIAIDITKKALRPGETLDSPRVEKLKAQLLKDKHVELGKDPLNVKFGKLLDMQIVGQLSDDVTGLDNSHLIRKMQGAAIQRNSFNIEYMATRNAGLKAAKKEGLSPDQIGENLHLGNTSEATKIYQELFDELRDVANAAGASIAKRTNYLPMKQKRGAELIVALEDQYKALKISSMDDTDIINDLLVKLTPENTDEIISKLPVDQKDFAVFVSYVNKHLNKKTRTIADLQEIFETGVLRQEGSLRKAANPEIGAAFQRKGDMPDWIREWNVDKLVHEYMNNVGKIKFLQPIAREMDQRMPVLRSMGQSKTAEKMHNWRQDVMGASRDNFAGNAAPWRVKYDIWAMDKNVFVKGVPEFVDVMSTAIYPNLIGMSPRAVLRNLFQPYTMTAPEMGWWYGTTKAVKHYGRLITDWKGAMKELDSMNLRMKNLDASSFEGLQRGITESVRGMGTTRKVIDTYARIAMTAFSKSDEANRYLTMKMAQEMAEDIASGTVSKGGKKALSMLPVSMRNKIGRVLKANDNELLKPKHEILAQELGEYYVSMTQLIYGKVGMHELGRDIGPAMAMMSKWPVAVGSDMYYKMQNKQWDRIFSKYFAPLGAASVLSMMMLPKDSVRGRTLVGAEGFQDYLPVNSIFSFQNVVIPVNVSSPMAGLYQGVKAGGAAFRGDWDAYDTRSLKASARKNVQQYVPVVGGAWRAADIWYWKLMLGEN